MEKRSIKSSKDRVNIKEALRFWTSFICETFNITENELKLIEKRIKSTNGLVRIFMHPFTIGDDFSKEKIVSGSATRVYEILAKAIIQNTRDDETPLNILMLEDNILYDKIMETYVDGLGINLKNRGTIVSQTADDKGSPSKRLLEYAKKDLHAVVANATLEEVEKNKTYFSYAIFFKMLKLMGVRSFIAYGGYIGSSDENDLDLARCLGTFVNHARLNGLKVNISGSVLHKEHTKAARIDAGIKYKDMGYK